MKNVTAGMFYSEAGQGKVFVLNGYFDDNFNEINPLVSKLWDFVLLMRDCFTPTTRKKKNVHGCTVCADECQVMNPAPLQQALLCTDKT